MSKSLINRKQRVEDKMDMVADSSSSDGSGSDTDIMASERWASRKSVHLPSHQHNVSQKSLESFKSKVSPIKKKVVDKRRIKRSHVDFEELKHSELLDDELSKEHIVLKRRKEELKIKTEEEFIHSRKNIKMAEEDVTIQGRLKISGTSITKHSGNAGEQSESESSDDQQQYGNSEEEHAGNSGEERSGIPKDTKDDNEEVVDNEDEMRAVKEELSHLSFEELHQLKEKLGTKVFNQVMHGKLSKPVSSENTKKNKKKVFKRANKSRPMEMSSKKTVSRSRQIIPVKKRVFRDPRFDDLSGEFSEEFFQKSYSFLDDVKSNEKQKLEKLVKKEKDPEKRRKIKLLLNRMRQQDQSSKDKAKRTEQEKQWTQRERELVAQGKKPYFLKKSDKRKLELAEKYKELQQSGNLEKYLSKKRKKNTQKERKRMPNKN